MARLGQRFPPASVTGWAAALAAVVALGVAGWLATRAQPPDSAAAQAPPGAAAPWNTAPARHAVAGSADPFMSPRAPGPPPGPLADPLLGPGLRDAIEALLNAALEGIDTQDTAALKRRMEALVGQHFAADVRDRALAIALRYVDYRTALGRVPPPADLFDPHAVRDAMQARGRLRQQLFDGPEYEALFAADAALDRHTLARLEIAADPALTPAQRTQALSAAEATLPAPMRAARQASVAHLAAAEQTAALDARQADAATRLAERSARYGDAAAQALARRDSEERQWQDRLNQYQQARAGDGEGAALQRLREQLFSPEEQLRVEAALALRDANSQ
ncbi:MULTISPECIES: lipase secretion chaperone [unclassified Acidovorax]|uniref:lipase secretion chaperone n=1 Tax=unclassified Acidovorax TaxID=2684926 RepID=UPI00288341A2|nr:MULTISPECIES: lipase secretion chaperone [unclassified Acidovorax]